MFKIDGERVPAEAEPGGGAEDDDSGEGDNTSGESKTVVDGEIAAYGWTGMNMYLQYSDGEGLGMGGGGAEGSFGLFVGEDFLSGSTGRRANISRVLCCFSRVGWEVFRFFAFFCTFVFSSRGTIVLTM